MGYSFADFTGLVADHDENALGRRQIEGGIDHMLDERAAARRGAALLLCAISYGYRDLRQE